MNVRTQFAGPTFVFVAGFTIWMAGVVLVYFAVLRVAVPLFVRYVVTLSYGMQ
jgi:hypothetical protein